MYYLRQEDYCQCHLPDFSRFISFTLFLLQLGVTALSTSEPCTNDQRERYYILMLARVIVYLRPVAVSVFSPIVPAGEVNKQERAFQGRCVLENTYSNQSNCWWLRNMDRGEPPRCNIDEVPEASAGAPSYPDGISRPIILIFILFGRGTWHNANISDRKY